MEVAVAVLRLHILLMSAGMAAQVLDIHKLVIHLLPVLVAGLELVEMFVSEVQAVYTAVGEAEVEATRVVVLERMASSS
jgi:hypothetical protein